MRCRPPLTAPAHPSPTLAAPPPAPAHAFVARAVFDAGRDAMRSYANWRNNKTKIEQSQLMAHRKKRKSRK